MGDRNEAFARVKIDELLRDAGWKPDDGLSVRLEERLTDGTKADYVLCDRHGRPMAVLEAKRAGVDPAAAQAQGRHYAQQLDVPFVFLSNGEEVWFLDRGADAHARRIDGFYGQEDLERRVAARQFRRDLSTVAIDRNVVNRGYQVACIEALSQQVLRGRRKLLVEMATGTGKTRTAAAFIKRLFQARMVTRVLFLVNRIALARQAEEAFTDHLRAYPCHVLRPGRSFDRAKLITVANLQTMVTEFRTLRERLWLGIKGLECPPGVELLRNGCPAHSLAPHLERDRAGCGWGAPPWPTAAPRCPQQRLLLQQRHRQAVPRVAALGRTSAEAAASLRFGLGRGTTVADIDQALAAVQEALAIASYSCRCCFPTLGQP